MKRKFRKNLSDFYVKQNFVVIEQKNKKLRKLRSSQCIKRSKKQMQNE